MQPVLHNIWIIKLCVYPTVCTLQSIYANFGTHVCKTRYLKGIEINTAENGHFMIVGVYSTISLKLHYLVLFNIEVVLMQYK